MSSDLMCPSICKSMGLLAFVAFAVVVLSLNDVPPVALFMSSKNLSLVAADVVY